MRFETLAVHAGRKIDAGSGAVMPPIVLSTTFERNADGSYAHDYVYTRWAESRIGPRWNSVCVSWRAGKLRPPSHPGRRRRMSVLQAMRRGDHVIIPDDVYFGTRVLAT